MLEKWFDTKISYRWMLLGVILLAFALRVYRLDSQSLRGDEAASAVYATFASEKIIDISRGTDPHPPLFYASLHGWESLTGLSEFAVRFWVLIPAVLAVPALYVLLRILVNRRVGWAGAMLLAFNSFHIWHSQDVRSYTWLILLGLLASIFLWQALYRQYWHYWASYSVIMAVLFYVHYYAVFFVAFHGLYAVWMMWQQKPKVWLLLRNWLASICVAGIAFLPWLVSSWRFIFGFRGDFDPASPVSVLWRSLYAYSGGVLRSDMQKEFLVLPLIFLVVWGGIILWYNKPAVALFLSLYLAMPLLGIMILSLRGQAFTERYSILAQPAYLAFLAVGIVWLWQRRGWALRWLGWAVLGMFILLNLHAQFRYQFDPDLAKSPQWRQTAEFIIRNWNPATDVIVYNAPDTSVTYYLDARVSGEKPPNVLMPHSADVSPQEVARQMEMLLAGYQRVWFIPVNISGWDDHQVVNQWFERHADRLEQRVFHWTQAELYLTPAEIDRRMVAQPAQFTNGIDLRGFRIADDAETHVFSADGDSLALSLYWQSAGPTESPLTVFVQLIDSTGFLRGGQDNQPVWGTYPTDQWQAGEGIIDKYELSLQADAPPGVYQVWVGLYNPQTGERVPVLDALGELVGDHVVLDVEVEVK